MLDSDKLKKVMFEACHLAGELQLKNFTQAIQSTKKESISSIVTFVDLASEKLIIDHIKKGFPTHNILSEESGFENNNSDITWVIDPLDGTSNYSAGLPWFGVLIAVMEKSLPILGAAYLPVDNQLYFAQKGKGAFLNNQPIKVSQEAISECLVAFSTDYCKNETCLNNGVEIYKYLVQHSRNVRTTNSLIDLVNVANGKMGACVNLFNGIWDIAATSLIIEEAGGKICSIDGSPLRLNISSERLKQNYAIISGNSNAYNMLRTFIASNILRL